MIVFLLALLGWMAVDGRRVGWMSLSVGCWLSVVVCIDVDVA
jgi:hypothetical protein